MLRMVPKVYEDFAQAIMDEADVYECEGIKFAVKALFTGDALDIRAALEAESLNGVAGAGMIPNTTMTFMEFITLLTQDNLVICSSNPGPNPATIEEVARLKKRGDNGNPYPSSAFIIRSGSKDDDGDNN